MKHKISLLLAVILATVLCLPGYASATQNDVVDDFSESDKQKAIALAEQFALEYETAKLTLSMPEFSYIQRTDDTALHMCGYSVCICARHRLAMLFACRRV